MTGPETTGASQPETVRDTEQRTAEQKRSYAAARSAAHRPTLSLHGFHEKQRSRLIQLSWVGLRRSE